MDPSDTLTKETILAALRRLDELLREKGIIGEICIFGGAAMVLAFDARESTRDVDAVFVPKDQVLDCARLVASEFGMDDDWMNNGVKGFISDKAEVSHEGMPVFDNLRVMRPTTEYLLAMKCLASRVGPKSDRADVITLQLHGISFPSWVDKKSRRMESPWFAANTHNLRMILLQESPAAFRIRNLFVSANALSRA